jgi:hypothetical protein
LISWIIFSKQRNSEALPNALTSHPLSLHSAFWKEMHEIFIRSFKLIPEWAQKYSLWRWETDEAGLESLPKVGVDTSGPELPGFPTN